MLCIGTNHTVDERNTPPPLGPIFQSSITLRRIGCTREKFAGCSKSSPRAGGYNSTFFGTASASEKSSLQKIHPGGVVSYVTYRSLAGEGWHAHRGRGVQEEGERQQGRQEPQGLYPVGIERAHLLHARKQDGSSARTEHQMRLTGEDSLT